MLELPHVIVGATIASRIGNPFLSLSLVLLSHFIIDIIPHWNPHIYREKNKTGEVSSRSKKIILADSLMALLAGTLLALRFYPHIFKVGVVLIACFLAVLPDLVEAPYFFVFKAKSEHLQDYINWHRRIQKDGSFWLGLATQVATLIICLFFLFF